MDKSNSSLEGLYDIIIINNIFANLSLNYEGEVDAYRVFISYCTIGIWDINMLDGLENISDYGWDVYEMVSGGVLRLGGYERDYI